VRSLALQSAGDHKGALAALADALSLARPEGYVRVFADEGPQMGDLLKTFIRARESSPYAAFSRAAREHVSRVVRAFPPPAGSPASVATAATRLVVPLTRRELEILAFVAAGKPNREIADQLVVTLDTVKKHVSNIFGKLGAANRTEAVARAREFGLTE
jgi:LuxR family transcriptional regulator, maltose regulon positive regulatory protein